MVFPRDRTLNRREEYDQTPSLTVLPAVLTTRTCNRNNTGRLRVYIRDCNEIRYSIPIDARVYVCVCVCVCRSKCQK